MKSTQLGRPANIVDAWHKLTGAEYTSLVTDEEVELRMTEQIRRSRELWKRYELGDIDGKTLLQLQDDLDKEITKRVAEVRRSGAPVKKRTEWGWT